MRNLGNRLSRVGVATLVAFFLAGCGAVLESSDVVKATGGPEPWNQAAPRAVCGPDDAPETDLQGRVQPQDRVSGRSLEPYTCNLELVGQNQGEGAGWQLAWHNDCAYHGQARGNGFNRFGPYRAHYPGHANPGTVVLDVSDPTTPERTTYLMSTSMIDPWESLKVNGRRELLGAINGSNGSGGPEFDFYDISGDCSQPRLLASTALGTSIGHGGNFVPDGMTYYGGPNQTAAGFKAVDVSDPSNPKLLLEGFPLGMHDHSGSEDGTRLYMATTEVGGLSILDVSEIQRRKPDPQAYIVSTLDLGDNYLPQMTQPVFINRRPFVLYVDEGFSSGTSATRCAQGDPPWGSSKLIDISDETAPKITAILRLEVQDPANCESVQGDSQTVGFQYDAHYCTASDGRTNSGTDVIHNAVIAVCGYFESGLRVFDIRNPYRPREIAYYNPGGSPGYRPGAYTGYGTGCAAVDWAAAHSRYIPERNEIWMTSQCNGFQVLRFKKPLAELLGPAW
jgi:hypothetical protein